MKIQLISCGGSFLKWFEHHVLLDTMWQSARRSAYCRPSPLWLFRVLAELVFLRWSFSRSFHLYYSIALRKWCNFSSEHTPCHYRPTVWQCPILKCCSIVFGLLTWFWDARIWRRTSNKMHPTFWSKTTQTWHSSKACSSEQHIWPISSFDYY